MKRTREKGIALITALLVMLLITSLIAGFSWLVLTDQAMGGDTNQRQKAFYGAEAGMEQLTSALNNLFAQNYAPTNAQVNALVAVGTDPATNPATANTFQGISFVDPTLGTVGSGYNIAFTSANGKTPDASTHQITAGPYQGLTGLITPYTLNVITQSTGGAEVKLQRIVQTVGIPLFEFGIFSQTDLSFFAGPNFSFGGRVHTNGNLFLAEGNGATLTLGDKVTAVGEVIRTNLSNGWNTAANYTGTVDVLTAPGSFRALATTEGSLTGTLGSGNNPNWQNISIGTYHTFIRDGDLFPPQYNGANSTGALALNLTVATPAIGGTPIDLIRRPIQNEDTTNPPKLNERYFAGASLRILLSDNPADITLLPCVSPGAPIDLSTLAQPVASWPGATRAAVKNAEPGGIGAAALLPLAASGGGASYNTADGYWVPANTPIITGYLKVEAATAYGTPCASYTDVTAEVLGLGYTGRNTDPVTATTAPTLPTLPGVALPPSGCQDPHPNAIIRIQRVRDNPTTNATNGGCGVNTATGVYPSQVYDYWPNALFDPREGNPRDWCPTAGVGGGACKIQPTLGGVMYYVELDVANLVNWFTGAIGSSGAATKDVNTAPNDFSVYFSDRRGNFIAAPQASGWPPASPSGNETGEFGFNDWVNPNSGQGCPNGALDTGEGFDSPQDATSQNYGALLFQGPYPTTPGAYVNNSLLGLMTGYNSVSTAAVPPVAGNGSAVQPSWQCGVPPGLANRIWPGYYARNANEARENPALFFRRALKLVNGSVINLGVCPNGVNCGLTIASENPVYVQGNYNCGSVGCASFAAPYGAAAVLGDTFTFLSNNWNDVNSFSSTYDAGNGTSFRNASTTYYRVAIAAGKGISFPQPAGTGQDFGTDGGVHNFLRYIENWGGSGLNYRGSIISLYYNRQGTGVYKCCTTVYNPPTRGYNFDTDFLTPALLPPRTPMFRTVNTIGFTEFILPSIQ